MTPGYVLFIALAAVLGTAGLFCENSGFAGAVVVVCLGMLVVEWFLS